MELSLALLGPPVVRRDGALVTFDTRKATALLALLAVTGREHTREQLADLLWPEADSVKGRASLRRTLSVTAAAMGHGLIISRAAVALDPAAVRVDVTEFGTLIGRTDAASLERAAALYRSDFLAGFTLRDCPEFEEWQASVTEELRQALARGLQRLVAACIAAGALERAAGHARRWLELDPLHEPAHQAIIRLHGWAGQRSAAMRQYRSLVRVLDRELAVRPLPETTRLYDDVRAGRLGPPPAPAATAAAGAEPAAGAGAGAEPTAAAWPLVGREDELAALRAAWRAAGSGGGRVVAIAGQAGSGKTRLITELRDEAAGTGTTVLAARCHDGETGLPFVLAADLLRTTLAIRPELPATLPAQTAAMAGRLVPALAGTDPAAPAAPPLDSPMAVTRLYAAIADILRAAASPAAASPAAASPAADGGRPGIVVVEDVQWADGSSLALLAYLVRRLADWPLLLVLSWQPEQDGRLRVLRTALAEAESRAAGATIEPGPLGPEAVSTLLGLDGMPRIDVDLLLAETRGLPMLVREYVEAFRAVPPGSGPLGGGPPGSGPLGSGPPGSGPPGSGPLGSGTAGSATADWWPPASVRDLFRTRLDAVSEPARQMLTAAAVLGSDNDADLLRAVSGRGEDEIVEAIDETLARSLLTEIAPVSARQASPRQAPSYGFPYEALRRTAYESATLARRRLLHGRAADALIRRHERDPATTQAATVAGHLQLAGRDGEAAQWWWRAAEVARELYAHAEAHAHLTRALALGYPELPGRVALAEVLVVLGRYREALAELETAAAIAAEGEPGTQAGSAQAGPAQAGLVQAGIEHRLADVHHRLGDWDLAEAHLAVVTELVEGAEPGLLARAQADRAVVAYRRGAAGQAAELGRAALASARAAADPGATAQALNVLGMLAARAGDSAAAERYLRDGLAQARQRPEPGATVAALNNLARLLAETGRGAEALSVAAEALELGRELGDQHRVAALHTNLADLLHADGQRDAAMTHLKEAARRFAAVDVGDAPRPEIWTLVEW